MDVQRNLEANVEKRMKDTYGPPPGKLHISSYYHMPKTLVSSIPIEMYTI